MYRRIIITVAALLIAFPVASSASVDELFKLYGIENDETEYQADIMEDMYTDFINLKNEIETKQLTNIAYEEFVRTFTTFLQDADEELFRLTKDMEQLELLMKVSQDEPLTEILKLDNSYRVLQEEYENLMKRRQLLAQQFNSVENVKVTNDELALLSEKQKELSNYKAGYEETKNEKEIGEVVGAHPVLNTMFITSQFGWRTNPITKQGVEFHQGLDFRGSTGTAVVSKYSGIVRKVGTNDISGNYVWVDHYKGKVQTLYAHLSKTEVEVGQTVSQYQVVGRVGSTGRSNAPHLHFGLYINGNPVDPALTMKQGER